MQSEDDRKGIEAGANVADALMQRDNAKYARKARKKVEDFDPEVPEFPWDEMMLTACDHNPSLPECLGPGFRRGVGGVGALGSGGAADHDAEGRPNEARAVAISN